MKIISIVLLVSTLCLNAYAIQTFDSDWKMLRTEGNLSSFTAKSKKRPDIYASVQIIRKATASDLKNFRLNFSQRMKQKRDLMVIAGMKNWTVTSYKWQRQKNGSTVLHIEGFYTDLRKQETYFYEVRKYDPKTLTIILYVQPKNKNKNKKMAMIKSLFNQYNIGI